jgi:two-component system cell cycle response regulator
VSARILVVDDAPANVRLLEARLLAEYFDVLTAAGGVAALQICETASVDLVLLDVMMPGMDGFEVCRRLRANPATAHIPVVMVTALDQPEDRVRGLEAGADDFLTKPVNDLALVTRVKSLLRLKMLTDELRLRAATGLGPDAELKIAAQETAAAARRGRILVVDDRPSSYERIVKYLSSEHAVSVASDPQDALFKAADGGFDAVVISSGLAAYDYLRLASQLRSLERTRSTPLIVAVGSDQESGLVRALDIGVNDYIRRPIDRNELLARVRTQIRQKRYQERLRETVRSTLELAMTDPLTGLHNRRYLDTHLVGLFEASASRGKPMSMVICDIDRFKEINDRYGHPAGDEVLREFAERVRRNIRHADLACRYGGEEFVVAMPDTDLGYAIAAAERIRREVEAHLFVVSDGKLQIPVTVSIGVGRRHGDGDSPAKLLQRADAALYNAKRSGRNRVMTEAA